MSRKIKIMTRLLAVLSDCSVDKLTQKLLKVYLKKIYQIFEVLTVMWLKIQGVLKCEYHVSGESPNFGV